MGGDHGEGSTDVLGLVLREDRDPLNKALGNVDSRDFVVVLVGGVGGVPTHVEIIMFVTCADGTVYDQCR